MYAVFVVLLLCLRFIYIVFVLCTVCSLRMLSNSSRFSSESGLRYVCVHVYSTYVCTYRLQNARSVHVYKLSVRISYRLLHIRMHTYFLMCCFVPHRANLT